MNDGSLYSLILVLQSLYWLIDEERRHKSIEKASKQDWFRHTFGFDAVQDTRYN